MDMYNATEAAYKNGYEIGYKEAMQDIISNYTENNISIPDLVDNILTRKFPTNIKVR